MKLTAKVAIAELAGRGELLGVSIDGELNGLSGGGPFCIVKGSRRLIDLAFLGEDAIHLPVVASKAPVSPTIPVGASAEKSTSIPNLDAFMKIIEAMELAQDLDVGDPGSGEKANILVSILHLLERYLPQYPLFIMLHGEESVPEKQDLLFTASPEEVAGGWLSVRTPGHSVWIPDVEELPEQLRNLGRKPKDSAAGSGEQPFGCAVAVPLWEPLGNGESSALAQESGLIFLIADKDSERDPLLRLAELLSRFVSNRWRHQREVNQRIHVDSLTKLYNRAFFDSQFPLELERARRSEIPLTLVIADLDKFKLVNDTYGHPSGDAVLRMVARRLQEELRRVDHICRIGGEEFGLILPATSHEAAQEVMGRLLDSKFRTNILHKGKTIELGVTFSYGVVTFPAGGSDFDELFGKADRMCFESKELGRNRCHFWISDEEQL
ncbi:MAG: GGDEF domain-containing protein, partial [Candidatus Krumholzibacteria bacterium]|nr:GGDEF domain-containing protein [Candidatus Krumholzibacteria bacterium]